MQTRYYMPELLVSLQLEAATDILRAPDFRRLACKCPFCKGQTDASIGKTAKEHFLIARSGELTDLNASPESARMADFLKKTERALRLTVEVRKKLAISTPTQHFKTWLEVFPEVAKRAVPSAPRG